MTRPHARAGEAKRSPRKSPSRPSRPGPASLPPRSVVRDGIAFALERLQGPGPRDRARSPAAGPGLVAAAVAQRQPLTKADHKALAVDLLHGAQQALDA